MPCKLTCCGSLAGTLKTYKHYGNRGPCRCVQGRDNPSHQQRKLIPDYLYHLLTRGEALHDLASHGLDFNRIYEIPGDLEVDVRLKEGHPYLFQRLLNIGLRKGAVPAKLLKYCIQFFREIIKHTDPASQ